MYTGGRSTRQHSKEYRDFAGRWGFQKIIFEMADEKVEKVIQLNQTYLTTTFFYLSYLIDKGEVDEVEDKFQENLRKSQRH